MEKNFVDVEDYESKFLERYLRRKAEKRIAKLTMEASEGKKKDGDSAAISDLQAQISAVREDLEKGIELVKVKAQQDGGAGHVCVEADLSAEANNDNDEKRYLKKLSHYCQERSVAVGSLNEHLRIDSQQVEDLAAPRLLWQKLFPFQQEGVRWLYSLFKKSKGAILADEMGLGKTLQVICFVSSLFRSERIRFVLIVSPATVMDHWVSEWKKNHVFVRICVLHRNKTSDVNALFSSFQKTGGVGILSYEGFKVYLRRVKAISWDCVVLDEGHRIKNQKSHISQQIKGIACKRRIILTGTPMQNNLAELWNLMDFTNPTLLGSYETFKREFEDQIIRAGHANATRAEVDAGAELSSYLKKIITPYVFRRTKKDVNAQLPKKTEKMVFCELTQTQSMMYQESLNTDSVFKILQGKKNVLCGIDMLRKICNHPYLWSKDPRMLESKTLSTCSAKMVTLNSLLDGWKSERRKALVFSQTVMMLNILQKNCEHRGYTYLRMDGKTDVRERARLVSRFNRDSELDVFLLTTKVGGLGLNLVGASRVVIYDPDWNPSVDSQAKERIYRYGQSRDVEIYKLICADTIEEKILHTQIFKSMLDQKVFTNSRLSRFFNKLDLDDLFTYTHSRTRKSEIGHQELDTDTVSKSSSEVVENDVFSARELISFVVHREALLRRNKHGDP